jgi:hypothetical protein
MNAQTRIASIPSPVSTTEARLARCDWEEIADGLNGFGCASIPKLLSQEECREIAELYPHEEHFRRHVHTRRAFP